MNQNEKVIEFSAIKKQYGNFHAVKGIDLTVHKGELFGFLGPNGAGKTTMIRILTGIIKPTSGNVLIKGYDLYKDPDNAKSRIGFVPDRPYLYEKLTPLEYFDFMGGLYNVNKNQVESKGEEMLKLFDLWDRRNELIESFSHGMKQKVAMSAAILHDPDIFVVDEPTVGLDPKSLKLAKDFFRNLISQGKTVFLTTHTLSVAQDLCNRIGIIRNGEIVALGSMSELQKKASLPGNDLESVFLKITEEEEQEKII
ncbi:MAG: type transport system ATP-binding protein [Clostridiales bacterium]|jgi:ABC-2 type transport system ATP-binding protein|nr:type transport system ATP-binding protein [Clostridiales bacterium]MDN5282155.1 type transport system ATP-binding protein [Candidatus Ozemobacter sp.]